MIPRPGQRVDSFLLLAALCTLPCQVWTDAPAVTFSHVYKVDLERGPGCNWTAQPLSVEDQTGELQGPRGTQAVDENSDIVFRHRLQLRVPKCDCDDSEGFKALLYRINGLEEEVAYLKSQCSQGCCGKAGVVDYTCSGHGTYEQGSCSCVCNTGWEGPDCSTSSCPDECNDNGRCVDGRCVCHEGYGDEDCSQLLCLNDCSDKGRCVDGVCICNESYGGEDCSQLLCPNNCSDKGRCVDGVCICHGSYGGEDCSQLLCPNDCSDNGRCVGGVCICNESYGGEDCSQLLCPNDCSDKGRCVDGVCICFSPYSGEDCSMHRCLNDCTGNGRCMDGVCVCDEAFFADDCSQVMGPENLHVVRAMEGSLQVEWDPVSGAEHYVLTYHPEGAEGSLQSVKVPHTDSSYLISGLVPGVTYVVRVYAVIKEITSNADILRATTVLSVDGIRVLGQTEDTIQVDWQNPEVDLDHFRLIHAGPEGQEEELTVPKSEEVRTKHTIIGLFPGTEYLITVQAIKGTYKGKTTSVTGVTDLDHPTNLVTREVTEDMAVVSWDGVQADVDGYVISYRSAGGSSQEILVGADSNSYRLTGLKPGVLYTVYVWAVKGSRSSRKSSTQAETDLDPPTNLVTRDVTEDTTVVSWDGVQADVDGYVISYSFADGSSQEILVGADSTSYRLTDLKPGVLYTVYVWAVKGSRSSRKSSTQAETDLDPPTNLVTRDITEDTAVVIWDRVQADVDGYVISYRSADGSSHEIPMGADSASYRLTGLKPGVLYTVYVWAVKGSRSSRKSSTQAETDLDPPTNLVTRDVTEDTAVVIWDGVQADVDGYVISYSSADGSSQEIPVGADSASYSLTSLKPGVHYTVCIWAVKGSRSSRKSSTQAETDIDTPKDLKASGVELESADLTWTPPEASIEGYILTYKQEDGSSQVTEEKLSAKETRFSLASLEMGKRYVVTLKAYRGDRMSRLVETTFSTVGLLYPFPMDCTQVKDNDNLNSRVYTIYVNGDRAKPMQVYCDMTTDGGGWIVFQRRTNGKLDFMKRWKQYSQGFGDMADEFWLGLEKLHDLTNSSTQYELRVDMSAGSETAYAVYDRFKIAPVKQKYKLTIGNYRGTAGDALTYHQGRPFSTIDSDNDISLNSCALTHRGAWWYKNCHLANLNGKYGDHRHSMGLNWEPWKGHLVSLDTTEMKIRPVNTSNTVPVRKRRSLGERGKSRKVQAK